MAPRILISCALIIISMLDRQDCQTALEIIDSLIDTMPVVPASLWTPDCGLPTPDQYLVMSTCIQKITNTDKMMEEQLKANLYLNDSDFFHYYSGCKTVIEKSYNCCATFKACPFLYGSTLKEMTNKRVEVLLKLEKKVPAQYYTIDRNMSGITGRANLSNGCKIDGKYPKGAACENNTVQLFNCIYTEEAYQTLLLDFWRNRQQEEFWEGLKNLEEMLKRCEKFRKNFNICCVLLENGECGLFEAPFYKLLLAKRRILKQIKELGAPKESDGNQFNATRAAGENVEKVEEKCTISFEKNFDAYLTLETARGIIIIVDDLSAIIIEI